jgi:hypothetical protein
MAGATSKAPPREDDFGRPLHGPSASCGSSSQPTL